MRWIDPSYGPYAGSSLAGCSHGAGASGGYAIGANGPLVGGAVGKAAPWVGLGSRLGSGVVDGVGPPQPARATIAAVLAANSRPRRGSDRDIAR